MYQDKSDTSVLHIYRRSDHAALERIGLHMEGTVLQHDFPPHRHEYAEAFPILGGSSTHTLGENAMQIGRGDVFVVKGDSVHGFCNVCGLEIINLMYTAELFSASLTEMQLLPGFAELFVLEPELREKGTYASALHLSDEALKYAETLARFIIHQELKQNPALDGVLRMNAAALMSFLAMQYNASTPPGHMVQVLVRAIRFMNDHLHEPLTLNEIARTACVSPRHLQRLFQASYRMRPMAYLRQLRLERAHSLLKNPEMTIAQVSGQCGFEDPAYFARCYKAVYGKSPTLNRISSSKPLRTF